MGFTVVSWGIGLSLVLISILALSHINKSYELGVMVFTTFICNKQLFKPYSGYLQFNYSFCEVCWLRALPILCILPSWHHLFSIALFDRSPSYWSLVYFARSLLEWPGWNKEKLNFHCNHVECHLLGFTSLRLSPFLILYSVLAKWSLQGMGPYKTNIESKNFFFKNFRDYWLR